MSLLSVFKEQQQKEMSKTRSQSNLGPIFSLFEQIKEVVESDLSWEDKYSIIFSESGCKKMRFLYQEAHLSRLDYYDPDTSYEEDVMAYFWALQDNLKQYR